MSDLALKCNKDLTFDLDFQNGDFVVDESLNTAVILSLFLDSRADQQEVQDVSERRGFWGDMFPEVPGDETGSKLWLHDRDKKSKELRGDLKDASLNSLQWIIDDEIAEQINCEVDFDLGLDQVGLEIEISKPQEIPEKFSLIWSSY